MMPRHRNGYVPADELTTFASGTNAQGYWEHQLPAGTLRKHRALVKIGQDRHNRTLQISPGWNAYRPIGPQRWAFNNLPAGSAASPGASSHGGTYKAKITGNRDIDAMAIDYGNWQWVFGTFDAFAAACREVSLTPGVIPKELWHVIDLDPYAADPAGDELEDFMATLSDDEKKKLLTQINEIHRELVEQPGAGWTRARIFATGRAVDKIFTMVTALHDFARLKIDAIWKWALGKRVDETVDGMPADSKLRDLVTRDDG